MGTRTGSGRAGNGAGVNNLSVETPGPGQGARFEETEILYSSDQDSESGDEEGSGGERRGVKRERSDREVRHPSASSSVGQGGGRVGVGAGVPGAKPGKKTRGRVKIKMEFIDNKLRRYTTFSKRKTGIMKKVGSQRSQAKVLRMSRLLLGNHQR